MFGSLYLFRKYQNPAAMLSVFKGVVSAKEWSIAAISRQVLPGHCCLAWTEFKIAYAALLVMNYSPPGNPYPTHKTLLDAH